MTRDQEKRRDNFMRLARMANVVPVDHFYVTDVFLEKFAEMVAAEEREACAKVCEEQLTYFTPIPCPDRISGCLVDHHGPVQRKKTATECAAAIRARGEE